MIFSAYSNRIYKNNLNIEIADELNNMIKSFNDAKIKC